MADNLAPDGMVFEGASEYGSRSGRSFCAPSPASLSASSFPLMPLCPLTHMICVVLLLYLIHAVIDLKSLACFEYSQPWSSHLFRLLVRPDTAYIESVLMIRARSFGIDLIAWRIACSSPDWFDCSGSGILKPMLRLSFSPNQTPPPAWAFVSPLLEHDPSV